MPVDFLLPSLLPPSLAPPPHWSHVDMLCGTHVCLRVGHLRARPSIQARCRPTPASMPCSALRGRSARQSSRGPIRRLCRVTYSRSYRGGATCKVWTCGCSGTHKILKKNTIKSKISSCLQINSSHL
jgi:hypothetical protein